MQRSDDRQPASAEMTVRRWEVADFPAVQALFVAEGWPTPRDRPDVAQAAWRCSTPVLVAEAAGAIVGFLRGLGDGGLTVYVAELLVRPDWRGRGVATTLLVEAQRLNPGARLDLLATEASAPFYERLGFRPFRGYRLSWEEGAALRSDSPDTP